MVAPAPAQARFTLPIAGMTCASCVARLERVLGKVDGVQQASVNLATAQARIDTDGRTELAHLVTAVEKAGFDVPELQELGTITATFFKDPDGMRLEVSHYA